MMTERSEIETAMDEALQCKTYRELEREILKTDKYEYSCSEETQEALEDADPTGKKLESYCTNLAEIEAEDRKLTNQLHEHVLICKDGCTKIREYRHKVGVKGY